MKKVFILIVLLISTNTKAVTTDEVRSEIKKKGILFPEIVLRQAILETGYWKSYNCRNRNNIFGFWYKGAYLEFDVWQDCVSYYRRWQDRRYTSGDYYEFLNKVGYASDPDYIWKLKHINPK